MEAARLPLMDRIERYLSGLKKAKNNLREGKAWVEDPNLFEEYLQQAEWMSENLSSFLQESKTEEQRIELLAAYSEFVKEYAFFLRALAEKKNGKVCRCDSKSKYSCPRDPEFPCWFPVG